MCVIWFLHMCVIWFYIRTDCSALPWVNAAPLCELLPKRHDNSHRAPAVVWQLTQRASSVLIANACTFSPWLHSKLQCLPTTNLTLAPTTVCLWLSPTTSSPTSSPTNAPTIQLTFNQTASQTIAPTGQPTSNQTSNPISTPMNAPTRLPTSNQTVSPTDAPIRFMSKMKWVRCSNPFIFKILLQFVNKSW